MNDVLPTRSQLLQACRKGEPPPDHPVLLRARALADLHVRRLGADRTAVRDIDECRARLVRDIDRWSEVRLPSPAAAPTSTPSLWAR